MRRVREEGCWPYLGRSPWESWAAFHAFRHTFASIHLSRGTNLLQLSRALGHHSAAFTLSRYTHLLPGDEAPALDLSPTTSDLLQEVVT